MSLNVKRWVWVFCVVWAAMLPGCGLQFETEDEGEDSFVPELRAFFGGYRSEAQEFDHLASEDPDLRSKAIAFFAAREEGGKLFFLKYFRLMTTHGDGSVRLEAVKALGIHGGVSDAKIYLAPRLKDKQEIVRWQAAVALGKIRNEGVVDALVDALQKDLYADVRVGAAKALGQYPSRRVFNVLVQAVDDRDFGVSYRARESLVLLTGEDLGTEAGDWLDWAEKQEGDLFVGRCVYTYTPFKGKRGFLNNLMVWRDAEFGRPKRAKGDE